MADTVEPREDRGESKSRKKNQGHSVLASNQETRRTGLPLREMRLIFFPVLLPFFLSIFFLLSFRLSRFFARPYVCPEPFLSRVLLLLFAVGIYLSPPLFILRRCPQVCGWGLTKNLGRESRFPTPLSLSNVALIPRWCISHRLSRDPLDPTTAKEVLAGRNNSASSKGITTTATESVSEISRTTLDPCLLLSF